MDPVKILKRAWHILWSYRALWVFGLILALAGAGSSAGNGNNGSRFNMDSYNQRFEMPVPGEIQRAFKEAGQEFERLFEYGLPAAGISQRDITAIIVAVAVFILVMLLISIGMAFARYTSETAVIRMVDEYEATSVKLTVRQGFKIGWSRTSWRLFLINLIVNIPAILMLAALAILGFVIYTMVESNTPAFAVASMVTLIGVVFLVIFATVLVSIVLRLLRQFFWRVCALEEVGVRESLRQGFQIVRENWKDVGIMWLIMVGLGIAWILVSFIAVIITLPLVVITGLIALVVVSVPGLLLVGLFSLFMSGYLPWIFAALFVLPLFFPIAFSPWVALAALEKVYTSSVWTLTYREVKALPAIPPEIAVGPVGD